MPEYCNTTAPDYATTTDDSLAESPAPTALAPIVRSRFRRSIGNSVTRPPRSGYAPTAGERLCLVSSLSPRTVSPVDLQRNPYK